MSDKSLTDCQSDTVEDSDSVEEEIEPKLKYSRLGNHLQRILLKDAISCIAVHPRFICLGSHFGKIYTLDHLGNSVESKETCKHTLLSINQISIERTGEYIAGCSDDGKVFIRGLYFDRQEDPIDVGRTVKTVALDPNYSKLGSNARFIIGDSKLTLYERTFLGRLKSTTLCESEGLVRSLCWGENFIAWSSDIGVRIYDFNARCSLALIKWESHAGEIEKFRCNLRWSNPKTLLIGWVDTVRVCIIRKRSTVELHNKDLPQYKVDPVSTFRTEFYISGIAPLDHQLVLLGFPKAVSNQKSSRPQLYIVDYRDNEYVDICTDSLSLRGYEEYNVNDYHLDGLIEENMFFIVAPKDVVVASPYDLDDRIQWLMEHGKYEDALNAVQHSTTKDGRYNLESVGIAFLDHLLSQSLYDRAGKLCFDIFHHKKEVWEEQLYKFAKVCQLRSVSQYVPRSPECTLNPQMYEMILYEYLKWNSTGFLTLVKEWNPSLYNTSVVINVVLEHLLICDVDRNINIEALAVLYSYEKKYDKSLNMYLQLKNKEVFNFIQKHNLYDAIHDMIVNLMDLDCEATIALLTEKNRVSPDIVVKKLENHQQQLFRFLDVYDKINPKVGQYHGKLVKLYAVFARNKLLPFLRRSDHYPIQEALDICQKEKFYPEMVYLLGRVGDTKEALELITKELQDMQQAIEFCQEHDDPDLWDDLINHSLNKPDFITYLLQHIGTYVDPTALVERIKNGQKVAGLKNSLVKMLCDYNLQVSVQEGCKKILVSDYFNLHDKLVKSQQKGIAVSEDNVCGACHRSIIMRDFTRSSNILMYNCKHSFHQQCLPIGTMLNCGICHPTKKV